VIDVVVSVASARPTVEDRIRAALWFAERGFGVFSVWSTDADGTCRCPAKGACENPGKHPVPRDGFKAATTDPARIRAMLSAGSEPNWGMLPPEGVFALDVDGEGVARLAELEALHGPLPPTLRTATAHGEHVFLRWPAGMPRPIGQLFGFITRWGSGANAGYVIGPRSVHASGAVYAPAGQVFEIAELPESWARARVDPAASDAPIIEIAGGYQLPEHGYTGARYDAIRDYVASRHMRGVSKDEILAGVLMVLAPRFAQPLSEPEVRSRFERAWKGTAERLGEPMDIETTERLRVAAEAAPASLHVASSWPEEPDPIVYHGPIGEIVQAVAPRTEAHPVGILATLLASAGACMGHGRYIYQGSAQSPNVFVVLVGDSSSGRKGTAGSVARDVMDAAYPDWSSLIVAGLGSGEGLVSHLKKCEQRGEHRALVMESEFGRLLTVMGREGSTLSPIVRDAWDGVPMGRFLARDQDLVRYHHVGVVAHVTPVELRQKLSGVDAANGFGNRFLWLSVRRTRLLPFPESPVKHLNGDLLRGLGRAIEDAQAPGEVPWSPAAREVWEDLYVNLTMTTRYGLLGAMSARAEAQLVRLALVYALLDRSPVIDVVHLDAARALWTYAEQSVRQVFGNSTGDRGADTLREMLADGPIDWSTARRDGGFRSGADLDAAVALLTSLGIAEVVKVREAGKRPRRHLRLAGITVRTTTSAQGARAGKGPKTA